MCVLPAVMLLMVQLDLYKSLPSGVQQSASQKLDIALATVAIGYQRHQPQLMQRAASLFQQLGEVADKVRCALRLVYRLHACSLRAFPKYSCRIAAADNLNAAGLQW
jgi:hypothetical protein